MKNLMLIIVVAFVWLASLVGSGADSGLNKEWGEGSFLLNSAYVYTNVGASYWQTNFVPRANGTMATNVTVFTTQDVRYAVAMKPIPSGYFPAGKVPYADLAKLYTVSNLVSVVTGQWKSVWSWVTTYTYTTQIVWNLGNTVATTNIYKNIPTRTWTDQSYWAENITNLYPIDCLNMVLVDGVKATSADSATVAGYAFQSTYSTGSAASAYAFQATYATNAGGATTAGYAFQATYATGAAASAYAFQSSYATNAGGATTAGYAFQATYATNAGAAAAATYAFQATYATGSAAAAYAFQAEYATNAGSATAAGYAFQSTYATNAGTAASSLDGAAAIVSNNNLVSISTVCTSELATVAGTIYTNGTATIYVTLGTPKEVNFFFTNDEIYVTSIGGAVSYVNIATNNFRVYPSITSPTTFTIGLKSTIETVASTLHTWYYTESAAIKPTIAITAAKP